MISTVGDRTTLAYVNGHKILGAPFGALRKVGQSRNWEPSIGKKRRHDFQQTHIPRTLIDQITVPKRYFARCSSLLIHGPPVPRVSTSVMQQIATRAWLTFIPIPSRGENCGNAGHASRVRSD